MPHRPASRRNKRRRANLLLVIVALAVLLALVYIALAGRGSSGAPVSSTTSSLPLGGSATTTSSATDSTATNTSAAAPATVASTAAKVLSELEVHFIDVGQGDSILILTPEKTAILIDGGEPGSGTLQYLKGQGVAHIDLLVATHPHSACSAARYHATSVPTQMPQPERVDLCLTIPHSIPA